MAIHYHTISFKPSAFLVLTDLDAFSDGVAGLNASIWPCEGVPLMDITNNPFIHSCPNAYCVVSAAHQPVSSLPF